MRVVSGVLEQGRQLPLCLPHQALLQSLIEHLAGSLGTRLAGLVAELLLRMQELIGSLSS